ncbi:putative dual specificity protein phosphatase DSP8 [Hibiscus syriacus]|uniref:phosphatidylglycerophosphatase n=1 Tax=Hibiscus syriacus TaxID=106335 RepID=A0A6A3D6E5_HIBSY|nr:putative dual specificity protein phosphatase DSP8 [Hibiscus syriacus]
MKIEELDNAENDWGNDGVKQLQIVKADDAKRVLVGAGARILFYPTLLYNVFRNKFQSEFRWWDEVDQLGAVPFPKDVRRLKQLGVGGVITLNEPFETLVSTSLYRAHGIDHLIIPTRDYLFAPSVSDISKAVGFIHKNASCGRTTYVHCKAGRGRSTTVVLCYLVEHKHMTPTGALEYVRSRRPRVLLSPSQWKQAPTPATTSSPSADAVMITKADLEGYHSTFDNISGKELVVMPRMHALAESAAPSPRLLNVACTVNGNSIYYKISAPLSKDPTSNWVSKRKFNRWVIRWNQQPYQAVMRRLGMKFGFLEGGKNKRGMGKQIEDTGKQDG